MARGMARSVTGAPSGFLEMMNRQERPASFTIWSPRNCVCVCGSVLGQMCIRIYILHSSERQKHVSLIEKELLNILVHLISRPHCRQRGRATTCTLISRPFSVNWVLLLYCYKMHVCLRHFGFMPIYLKTP